MGLKLDSECQAALDLAKRAVPEGGELDTILLLSAVYNSTHVREQHPELAPYLKPLEEVRKSTPAKVSVAESLQPVLGELSLSGTAVTAEKLFAALLDTEAAREHLKARHIPAKKTADEKAPESAWRRSPEREAVIKALSSFGRMLTATQPPHKGVVELEAPLKALVRTLSKMKRKNAIIIGYPGTGKSALVYELARRLVNGHPAIPPRLRDLDVFELSPSFLRSGASMVGQYDERVKSLIQVLQANPKVVLFVDEIHSFFQSGMHMHGPFTEANESFKAALGKGQVSCIGCTTTAEYRHYIEPDGALKRRFGIIHLEPPSKKTAIRILQARRSRVEDYYGLKIPDDVIERVVELTEEYLPSRFQPDKSIQLLDEACAYCVTSDPPLEQITEEALWQAIEDMIGHSVVRAEKLTEEEVYDQLRTSIIGQDKTLNEVSRAFVAGLGGWQKRTAPRGVFFFCGPTGVGKTETAVLLAKILGGGKDSMIRVDCNTLQGSGYDSQPAINRLLGVPPGYIGYARGQGGILSRIRDMPESIVLFDEIEKADPGVGKLLLQILDDGRVEDVDGNILDFRRSFIIFTTNAGCVYERKQIGFEGSPRTKRRSPGVDVEALKADLRARGYGQEFLGRISHFFTFQGLEVDAVLRIIQVQLERLHQSAELRGYKLEWAEEIVPYLSSKWQPQFGVRHLSTILRNRITEQLSVAEAQGELKGVKKIRLEVMDAGAGQIGTGVAGQAIREKKGNTLIIRIG